MSRALSLILILAMASIMNLVGTGIALGQQPCEDTAIVYLGIPTIEPCSLQNRINIPVYLNNPCPVGGFTMQLYCSDPSWASFDSTDLLSADTLGSRISGWESFNWHLSPGSHSMISVVAIANLDGNGHPLLPGDGLIFTIHPHLKSYLVCDTCQILIWGNVQISDSNGLNLLAYVLQNGAICVAPGPCNDLRGDANCSGELNGIDVVFLVRYFKGI